MADIIDDLLIIFVILFMEFVVEVGSRPDKNAMEKEWVCMYI